MTDGLATLDICIKCKILGLMTHKQEMCFLTESWDIHMRFTVEKHNHGKVLGRKVNFQVYGHFRECYITIKGFGYTGRVRGPLINMQILNVIVNFTCHHFTLDSPCFDLHSFSKPAS